ncbi:RHS repeat domain-containing protein [Bacillus rubiinfantis]|uniref:RHS repeat domain-containing protein n=1 Tax=Bacillus rubiinfantis TaxID=1499680 RepID=UPI000693B9C8|nr:RHS repeat-associated core domain-containing protein [Bacillus rubiinfantis]
MKSITLAKAHDKSGNILKVTDRHGTSQYEYDGNEQLIKETLPDGTINEYRYDKVGNRLASIQNGKVTKFSYNDGNQIIAKNDTNTFTYDADGNVKKDDQFIYEYNDLGAQTKVSTLANKEVAKYEYDEEGLRTKKIIGTKTYEYYYDGEDDNLALEVTKENNQVQRYRYYQWDENGKAVGMVIQDQDSSGKWRTKTYYFWTNQRGDVTTIVDKTGAELGSYTYDAYGNVLSETGTIAKENPIRYASYYYDQETKHYYLKARYYDPQNGNFLALDPHPGDDDDPVSKNGYTYAGNSPVLQVDPDGDFFWLAVNVGFAAYDGYKAYKAGSSWKR